MAVYSSSLYEHENNIENNERSYCCVLCNGGFLSIGQPLRDNEYGDECVVLKITNVEGEY